MLETEREEIQKQLQHYLDTAIVGGKKASMNGVARAIGRSTGTVSAWVKNKYTGNVDNIDYDIKIFLEREAERNETARNEIPFCQIKNALRVWDTAKIAHLNRQICVVYGEPGSGKTRAVKEYAVNNPDVILIETDPGYSPKILFRNINKALGLEGLGQISELFDNAVQKLKMTGRLLIVDEAEILPYRALELLRRLHDKAYIGILLSGMPRLYYNLRGLNGEYKQLYSRVRTSVKLEALREEDTEMIVNAFLPDRNGIYKTFHKVSSGNGRTLEMLLLNSESIARLNKRKIDEAVVEKASTMLMK
jgi:hypothetical protein